MRPPVWFTNCCARAGLHHSLLTFTTDVIYEGKDINRTFADNARPWVAELNSLAADGIKDPHPAPERKGKDIGVVVFWSLDGAARRELLGLTSASSTFPYEWADISASQSRDIKWFAPVTRTLQSLGALVPQPGEAKAESWYATYARGKGKGVKAHNELVAEPEMVLLEALHARIRLLATLLLLTLKVLAGSGCECCACMGR